MTRYYYNKSCSGCGAPVSGAATDGCTTCYGRVWARRKAQDSREPRAKKTPGETREYRRQQSRKHRAYIKSWTENNRDKSRQYGKRYAASEKGRATKLAYQTRSISSLSDLYVRNRLRLDKTLATDAAVRAKRAQLRVLRLLREMRK